MQPALRVLTLTQIVGMLMLLVSACSSPPQEQVRPAAIPSLPESARQPVTTPCEPYESCSQRLTKKREEWAQRLTSPARPASAASGSTTR